MAKLVTLSGGGPWGFRLVGGKDFHADLAISKVTPGGKAFQGGLSAGAKILEINNQSTSELTHLEAQDKVKNAGFTLTLKLIEPQVAGNGSANANYTTSSSSSQSVQPSKHTSSVTFTPSAPKSTTWQPPSKVNVTIPKPSAPDDLPPPPANLTYGMQKLTVDDPLPPPPSNSSSGYSGPIAYNSPSSTYKPTSKTEDSDKDPLCAGCKQIIRGPYLTALGQCWHPEEFVCAASNCRKPLQNEGFIEEKGKMYCKICYEKHFAHTCAKCRTKIIGEVMHALNQTWHMTCFVCTACSQPFIDGVFHLENDKPYCVNDYNRLFSTACKGCSFPIAAGDHYLEALGGQWHDTCFTCAVCHCDLKSVGFFASCNKPVCSNHKNAKIA